MKFVDDFRNIDFVKKLNNRVLKYNGPLIKIMEVCGTHTMNIAKFGIRTMINDKIKLLSGPGCPVCVTPIGDIENTIKIAKKKNVILTTFGDMMKVPGVKKNLLEIKSDGADIRVLYSPMDNIRICNENKNKEIVFVGVGFETTIPAITATILKAYEEKIKNFSVICMSKIVPPALHALLSNKALNLDALLLPGHVSAIIGEDGYENIMEKYEIVGVITGFEPVDILNGINLILEKGKNKGLYNSYKRGVDKKGNITAQKIINRLYDVVDSNWRGIGIIPNSGLRLKKDFSNFDALLKFNIKSEEYEEPKGCLCGSILQGLNNPKECKHFGKACMPDTPIGPCMVSSEGTCSAYYKYII